MNRNNNILALYTYFAKFVTQEVRNKQVIKKSLSKQNDYAGFAQELEDIPETDAIAEIEDYIFSINANYVSNVVRNSKGYLLFVEYGIVDIDKEAGNDRSQMVVAISVAHEVASSNSDMLEEILISQSCFDILKKILDKMYEDYESPESCQEMEFVEYPVEFYPIMPTEFFGRGGWTAMLKTGRILP